MLLLLSFVFPFPCSSKPSLKDCCYYLHCPSLDYRVKPDTANDRKNAEDLNEHLADKEAADRLHLTLSATFVDLQNPGKNQENLNNLTFVREREGDHWHFLRQW